MNFTGYLIEGTYDGATLTVIPKNKASRVALMGDPKAPDLSLERGSIEEISHKDPSAMINGHVAIRAGGKKFVLHFRRKQRDDMRALVEALG